MLNPLFNFATGRVALAAFIIFVVSTVLLGVISPRNKIMKELCCDYVGTDSTLRFKMEKIEKMFGLYKKSKSDLFEAHRQFIYYDLVYPLCYGLPLVLLLAYFYPAHPPGGARPYGWLVFLPLLVMAFDYAENLTMLSVVNAAETGPVPLGLLKVSRVFTLLKWIALGLSFILLLGFVGYAQARLRELVARG